jgi:hypothetical protein
MYIITANEAIHRSLWKPICAMLGYNEWVVAEGLMDGDHEIRLDELQCEELGIHR